MQTENTERHVPLNGPPAGVELRYEGDYRLYLRFADGVAGVLDLEEFLQKGVFIPLLEHKLFVLAALAENGQMIRWPFGELEIPTDTQYFRFRNITFEEWAEEQWAREQQMSHA